MNDEKQTPDATLRFLIVDDDPDVRFLLVSLLSPYAPCDEASNGGEALRKVEAALAAGQGYRLILLDLMMPGQDGLATLQGVRKLETEHRVQAADCATALMITAVDDADVIWGAHFDGLAAGYLVKPVKRDVLLRRLREMEIIA